MLGGRASILKDGRRIKTQERKIGQEKNARLRKIVTEKLITQKKLSVLQWKSPRNRKRGRERDSTQNEITFFTRGGNSCRERTALRAPEKRIQRYRK